MSLRLINIHTGKLTLQSFPSPPAYLAVSHAWGEKHFPQNSTFLASPGCKAVQATAKQRYPAIEWCWIDTLCIDQNDDVDKQRQIPLMGQIFGDAKAVVIILGVDLQLQQADIDAATKLLEPAVRMSENDAWIKEGYYWQRGPGRNMIYQSMKALARLTLTAWCTRIWTLQEYILAREVIWIGSDLTSLAIRDILFSALPDICNTLSIDECLTDDFSALSTYFSGMANMRLQPTERTRIMELLGNRTATLECDEVYGVMAASGVEIKTKVGEKREVAWQKWQAEALRRGHLRWLLMPKATIEAKTSLSGTTNCILTPFSVRHKSSAGAGLIEVSPLGPVNFDQGAATVYGRWVGTCKVISRLGRVHEPVPNSIYRDITLILFARGKWSRALRIASAFAGQFIEHSTAFLIARALIDNYSKALRAVRNGREAEFRVKTHSLKQTALWQHFTEIQVSQMPGMNNGVAYLASVNRGLVHVDTVIVLANDTDLVLVRELNVIDLAARTPDQKCIFMVVSESSLPHIKIATWHKVAMTLPLADQLDDMVTELPLQQFTIGGDECGVCRTLVHNTQKQTKFSIPPSAGVSMPQHITKQTPIPVRRKHLASRWPARPILKLRSQRKEQKRDKLYIRIRRTGN